MTAPDRRQSTCRGRHSASPHSRVHRARPDVDTAQVRTNTAPAGGTKRAFHAKIGRIATRGEHGWPTGCTAARHAAWACSRGRGARLDAVRSNPAQFRSSRAREKTGGRSGEARWGGRVEILRYVFECPRRSIGCWEVGWKAVSPREELALSRSARRTAPPSPPCAAHLRASRVYNCL